MGLQLVLHLFEGSEIRLQIFHILDMEDRQHGNKWNTVTSLLKKITKAMILQKHFIFGKNLEHYHISKYNK